MMSTTAAAACFIHILFFQLSHHFPTDLFPKDVHLSVICDIKEMFYIASSCGLDTDI